MPHRGTTPIEPLHATALQTRRRLIGLLASGGAGAVLASAGAKRATAQEPAPAGAGPRAIQPATVQAADASYSPGLLAEGKRILFVSGQGPKDLKADPETQMRQTFENIGAVLEAAGASWKNVAILRSYLVNMKRDLPIMRKVRREFLVKPYPASTSVGVTELAIPGLEIEIEAVAVL